MEKDQIASWDSCFLSALSPSVFAVACGSLRQGLCVCGCGRVFLCVLTVIVPLSVGSSVSRKLWFKSKLWVLHLLSLHVIPPQSMFKLCLVDIEIICIKLWNLTCEVQIKAVGIFVCVCVCVCVCSFDFLLKTWCIHVSLLTSYSPTQH